MVFNPSNERSKKNIYIYIHRWKGKNLFETEHRDFGGWRSGGLTRAKFIAGAVSDS